MISMHHPLCDCPECMKAYNVYVLKKEFELKVRKLTEEYLDDLSTLLDEARVANPELNKKH